MSEELLIRHCSPTLAGIKTGNLFSCKSRCREEVIAHIRKFNTLWQAKGLCALLLRHRKGRALIYVFRPHELEMDLSSSEAKRLLAEMGYCCTKPWHCLAELQCRLEKNKEFPHEIGLFLSYRKMWRDLSMEVCPASVQAAGRCIQTRKRPAFCLKNTVDVPMPITDSGAGGFPLNT